MAMADDGSHLPEKENITPNQHSWPETAAQMGVKRDNKAKKGKVNSALTAEHIGERNRKRADESRSQQWEKSLLNSKGVGMQVEGV